MTGHPPAYIASVEVSIDPQVMRLAQMGREERRVRGGGGRGQHLYWPEGPVADFQVVDTFSDRTANFV